MSPIKAIPRRATLAAAITLAGALALSGGLAAKTYEVRGVKALDGDSVIVEFPCGLEVMVRLLGIDTPEKGQPFADAVRDLTDRLVKGKTLKLETGPEERDQYNRLLAWLYDGDVNLNVRLVREGWAAVYIRPPNTDKAQEFLDAQKEAFLQKRGIWGSPGLDEDPRSFRYRKRHKDAKLIPLRYERHILTGNTRSKVVHWPACLHVDQASPKNLKTFDSVEEAAKQGYRVEKGFR